MSKIPFYASEMSNITPEWESLTRLAFGNIAKDEDFLVNYEADEIPETIPKRLMYDITIFKCLYNQMKSDMPEELTKHVSFDGEDCCADMLYKMLVSRVGHVLVARDWVMELIYAMEEYTGLERHNFKCIDLTGGTGILAGALNSFGCDVSAYDCMNDTHNIHYGQKHWCDNVDEIKFSKNPYSAIIQQNRDASFIFIHEPVVAKWFKVHEFLRDFYNYGNVNAVVIVIGDSSTIDDRTLMALRPDRNFETRFINEKIVTIPKRAFLKQCSVKAYTYAHFDNENLWLPDNTDSDTQTRMRKAVENIINNIYKSYIESVAGYFGVNANPMFTANLMMPIYPTRMRAFDNIIFRSLWNHCCPQEPFGFCDIRYMGETLDMRTFNITLGFKPNTVDMNWQELVSQMINTALNEFTIMYKDIEDKNLNGSSLHGANVGYRITITIPCPNNIQRKNILDFFMEEFKDCKVLSIDSTILGYNHVTLELYNSRNK